MPGEAREKVLAAVGPPVEEGVPTMVRPGWTEGLMVGRRQSLPPWIQWRQMCLGLCSHSWKSPPSQTKMHLREQRVKGEELVREKQSTVIIFLFNVTIGMESVGPETRRAPPALWLGHHQGPRNPLQSVQWVIVEASLCSCLTRREANR